MTGKIDEQLSALLDGELPIDQEQLLLKRVANDVATRDTLGRYGLIGDLVRDADVIPAAVTIADRVSAALDVDSDESATVTPGRHSTSSFSGSSSRTGFVGAGIAAAIAAVVMVNLAEVSSASRGESALRIAPVAAIEHGHSESHDSERLTRYLVAHAQFSNVASRQLVDSHLAMPVSSGFTREQ